MALPINEGTLQMTISSLKKRVISAPGRRTERFFVRDSQGTVEEDCPSFTNKSVDPEQSNTTQGETAEKPGRDVT